MATKVTAEEGGLLALIETGEIEVVNPVELARIVLLDEKKFDAFYERMKEETDRHVADVSTDAGRRAVISLSRRVVTTKTTITAAAKALTEEWRQRTASVNAARKPIEDRLAALAAEVRKPVTDWEEAEEARVARNRAAIERIRNATVIGEGETAAGVRARGTAIHEEEIGEGWTDGEAAEWASVKVATVNSLVASFRRLTQEEADRVELERLRAAEAERLEREEAERVAREDAERIAQAERDAAQRDADEKVERERREAADRERVANAATEAANNARRETEAAAERDRIERERIHAEELRAANAERDRLAAEAEREKAERDRAAAEDARRARNRAHVAAVLREAKEAIIKVAGASDHDAHTIVVAIKAGLVPGVVINF